VSSCALTDSLHKQTTNTTFTITLLGKSNTAMQCDGQQNMIDKKEILAWFKIDTIHQTILYIKKQQYTDVCDRRRVTEMREENKHDHQHFKTVVEEQQKQHRGEG